MKLLDQFFWNSSYQELISNEWHFFCRWFQIVLSVISAVILTFANTVRRGGSTQSLWASGFSFSAIGVAIAFLNSFWTFSSTRLSRRIAANKIEVKKIFPTLLRYCRISVILSLVGLLVSLIGKLRFPLSFSVSSLNCLWLVLSHLLILQALINILIFV